MKKLVRIMLVAALMATVAVPYTFISEHDANAAETAGGQAIMSADDSGPLPAWWAQTVYGEPTMQSGMAGGPFHFIGEADFNA